MAQLRELRQKVRSTKSVGKITKAMELIATSRISKAQARVEASRPYADEITNVLSALAGAASNLDDPFLVERENPTRVAVLVVTSDKGLCGAYNTNVLRATEELLSLLREQGKEPVLHVIGGKGVNYYRFRGRDLAGNWTGFSQQPHYVDAAEVGEELTKAFLAGTADAGGDPDLEGVLGVDEVHLVYTKFTSMLTQTPVARRLAPLEVEYTDEQDTAAGSSEVPPAYDFEPSAETLLNVLLPKYIKTRIYSALLESAASQLAAQRTAMKAASDNANELVETYTRMANQARQAQITQEISEIVGGSNALAASGGND
jgi:F-type H+-transporting ATPase subunit gamma